MIASSLTKRIIPCLDVKNGRTVKGIQFESLRDAGDPVELAAHYAGEGADELVFLDISATLEDRKTLPDLVSNVAAEVHIPFTVGGGISSESDVYSLLRAGADKISINSSAIRDPDLIERLALNFGSQCIVVAIDARPDELGIWKVYSHGGTQNAGLDLFEWAVRAQDLGAGEILFTAMSKDGTQSGYATEALAQLHNIIQIPIIASGGAGTKEDFLNVFTRGKADAALAASLFHFGMLSIPELKSYLKDNKIPVRC
jgi:cyclase